MSSMWWRNAEFPPFHNWGIGVLRQCSASSHVVHGKTDALLVWKSTTLFLLEMALACGECVRRQNLYDEFSNAFASDNPYWSKKKQQDKGNKGPCKKRVLEKNGIFYPYTFVLFLLTLTHHPFRHMLYEWPLKYGDRSAACAKCASSKLYAFFT